ncbi:MAG: nitroreductase family protein [Prevotellaceae bacterium]|jgi:nitroreductase|nr:nitroreductase family protein [Prevotellaceae bacterium]
MIQELIRKNRSYRRFYQDVAVDAHTLKSFVDLARLSPSARNLQPLKYIISNNKEINEKIFPTLAWAGYLKDWDGPVEGERPAAYIVIVVDKNITQSKPEYDEGIVAQSILLGAVEQGLGGCIIVSVKRQELAEILNLSAQYEIALVIALGKPKEQVVITDVKDNDIKYFRDKDAIHYVPKRSLDDIILDVKTDDNYHATK